MSNENVNSNSTKKTKEQAVVELLNGITVKVTAGIGKKSGEPYLALIPELNVTSGAKQLGDMVFVDRRGYALFEVYCELLGGAKATELKAIFESIKADNQKDN